MTVTYAYQRNIMLSWNL